MGEFFKATKRLNKSRFKVMSDTIKILTIKLPITRILGYALCRLTQKNNALESMAA